MKLATIAPVAVPPRNGACSTSTVRAPDRAAATAAQNPAGPPPATATSTDRSTSIVSPGRAIESPSVVCSSCNAPPRPVPEVLPGNGASPGPGGGPRSASQNGKALTSYDGDRRSSEVKRMGRAPNYPLKSVDHALQVLATLQTGATVTVGDVAQLLGIGRSSAHPVLSALVHRDFAAGAARARPRGLHRERGDPRIPPGPPPAGAASGRRSAEPAAGLGGA